MEDLDLRPEAINLLKEKGETTEAAGTGKRFL